MNLCIIRIRGEVGVRRDVEETLNRLRLKRKYSCVVLANPKDEQIGMIKKVKDFTAFGEISNEMFEKLLEKRGQLIDKQNPNGSAPLNGQKSKSALSIGKAKEIVKEIESGKKYEELNLKPFFRLHPPRKGIKSKENFGVGKGVLGNHKEKINELLERML